MNTKPLITAEIAAKVLNTVDAGLCQGLGRPEPGQMCVEAAVCYALGLPHGDNPDCVSPALRGLKIKLNDSLWSNNQARASGLRRLAVAQLGSKGELDEKEFIRRVIALTIRKQIPLTLRAAASLHKDQSHREKLCAAAIKCETEGTRSSCLEAKAYAASVSAAYAAAATAAARDKSLADFCEEVVQILISMNAPGCQWLVLTEITA